MQTQIARLNACHPNRFVDQRIQPVHFLINDCDQFLLGRRFFIQYGRCCSLDRSKGRLEFVREGVQEHGLHFFILSRRLHTAGCLLGSCSLHRNRSQITDGMQRRVGYRTATNRQAAHRLPAETERQDGQARR